MAKQLTALTPHLTEFIAAQHVFFVGTAAPEGRVNISPKGMDSLRVLTPNRVAWLNVTGSGNETAAHLLQLPRMTLMFCAFQGPPMILRLYGQARMIQPHEAEWAEAYGLFPPMPAARQIYILELDLVQTSCGMAVPFMAYVGDREQLNEHHARMTPEAIQDYQKRKNALSIDGFPTGLPGGTPVTVDT